jgi:hypothetical protein
MKVKSTLDNKRPKVARHLKNQAKKDKIKQGNECNSELNRV